MNLKSIYATNRDEEENGKWFDSFGGEVQLKMRRFASKKSLAIRSELEAPLKKTFKNRDIPLEQQEALAMDHFIEGVLLDWKGMTDDHGVEVPYSKAKAKELLTEYPDFFREAMLESIDMANFRTAKKKEIAGN